MQGIRVLVTSIGQGLAHILLPALGHLVVQPPTEITADVSFTLCDTAITAIQPPAPPFQPADYHRYGQRAVYTDENLSILHAPTTDMLLAYDRRLRYGICWVKDAAALSIYDRAAPLQTHFHWALRDHGWQVVHAAAIGRADGGVLLIGNSGAGKSTTAFSALKSGRLRYLSDDKCLVRLAPEPATSTLFCSAKIKEDILDEFPEFRPFIAGRDDESKVGKHLAFLYPHFRRGMIDSFPLRAIIIPRIRHLQEPALTPAGAGDAFRVLGPSTAIWLPGAEADSYHFLGQLVRQLPCYFLDLAFPPHANLSAIAELLDRYRVFSHPPK
ncbi:MAG: hypothetical protein R2873_31415 [Caldilineaceae bacterium]